MSRSGRPVGSGARYVRIEAWRLGWSPRVYIGRALWQELGQPRRITIRRDRQRARTLVYLLPVEAPLGYSVTQAPCPGLGMPKFTIGKARMLELDLPAGRYEATVDRGAIVFDLARPVAARRARA